MVQVTIPESSVRIEEKGYNRGLILGFTMAESMLLLVFCLLLVAGAVIASERLRTEKAGTEALVAAAELKAERERAAKSEKTLKDEIDVLRQKLRASATPAEREAMDKEWRELVLARDALAELKRKGVTPADVEKMVAASKTFAAAKIDWIDASKVVQTLKDATDLKATVKTLEAKASSLEEQLAKLRKENSDLQRENILLKSQVQELADASAASKPHQWPPIISLSEAQGYFFRSGSAELTTAFRSTLSTKISDQIAENLAAYDVDIIEVIGHTDEQPISREGSNLDKTIADVLADRKPVTAIIPADNAGLGLARAVAVANILRANEKLKNATVIPLSAAQLVLPGDKLTTGQAGDVESRRRIEIRIRRRS